jgi:prolyl-tRNA synthetase
MLTKAKERYDAFVALLCPPHQLLNLKLYKLPAQPLQADMFTKAKERYDACVETVTTWDAFMAALNNKHMALAPWADEEEVEEDVKKRSATADAMGAKTLCIPFQQPPLPEGTLCFASGKPAKNWALWGRSY